MEYKALNKQVYDTGAFFFFFIRFEDRLEIMNWRNEQIYHLRQNTPLTKENQDYYFENVVSKLFEQAQPNQILFSFLENENRPNPALLIAQIEKEIASGIIKPINPKHLLMNLISMTVFPFAAQMMIKGMLQISDTEFNQMMEERKTSIAEQIINSIKR